MTQQPNNDDCQWVDECYVVVEKKYRIQPTGMCDIINDVPKAACPTKECAKEVAVRMLADFLREHPDYPHKVAYTVSRVPILTR